MFFLDWKLHAKLLLFIGIPLLFCLIFIGVVHSAQRSAEAEATRLEHSRNVISTAVDLNLLTARAVQQLLFYSQTKDVRLSAGFENIVDRLPEQVTALRSLIGSDSEAQQLINEVDRCEDEASALLQQAKKVITSDNVSNVNMPALTRIIGCVADLNQAINRIILLEKARDQKSNSSDSEITSRHMVDSTLLGGVCAVIAIAATLLLLINKSITGRMSVLMKNINLITEAKELPAPMPGRDELAELDLVLHQMNEKLKEMEQLKHDFTSMITHDLRSPLTSIQLALQMGLAGRWGDLPPDLSRSLSMAENSSKRLLTLINELLDIDKMEAGKLELDLDCVPLAYILETSVESVKALAFDKSITIFVPDVNEMIYADGDRWCRYW